MLHQLFRFDHTPVHHVLMRCQPRRLAEHAGKMVFAEGSLRRQLGQRQGLPQVLFDKGQNVAQNKRR